MDGTVLYDDGHVVLDDGGITLARYYFPLASSKRIRYEDIKAVDARPMDWLTGRLRGWGTTHPGYWLPLDLTRFRKRTLIVLDTGAPIKPACTPADPATVLDLLRSFIRSSNRR